MTLARTPTRWQTRIDSPPAPSDIDALSQRLGVAPLVAQLLIQRHLADPIDAERFLRPRLADLPNPASLPGCTQAAQQIANAVHQQQPIVIYGDYDVDGITASAILYHTLTALHQTLHGTKPADAPVATYVPHRVDEGYGLNRDALSAIADYKPCPSLKPPTPDGQAAPPPLVVSVDCGITACDCATHAKSLGMPLIITDHHAFNLDELPDCDALVHPELPADPSQPSNPITDPPCGAGVAFHLAWQTARTTLNTDRLPKDLQQRMVEMLSLAALGTVADLVPLKGQNRVITATGLARMKQTRFPGLNALIEAAGLNQTNENVDAYKVGFVLGPRLNACGRMGHARQAVELLTTATGPRAQQLAEFLTEQNDQRRKEERRVTEHAIQRIEDEQHATDDRRAIVLDDPDFHPGVVGIVASRLVERYHRPVVLLAHADPTPDPNLDSNQALLAKGSARSVRGIHIQQAFAACAQHLQKFGGHAAAAGLTLELEHIPAFREAFIEHVNTLLSPDDLQPSLRYDADADPHDLHPAAFAAVRDMAPFGMGNPTPRLLIQNAFVHRAPRRVGKAADHLTLELRCGDRTLRAIAFGRGEDADTLGIGDALDVLFEPKLNTWNGITRAEMNILDFRPSSPLPV